MVKTVFDNAMVAHVWAQQSQESGRSNNGNFWFQGDTLYSYATPVAKMHTGTNGQRVALISATNYSPSTGKQLGYIGRAHNDNFRVPFIGASGGWRSERGEYADIAEMHAKNLAALLLAYDGYVAHLKRKQVLYDPDASYIAIRLDEVRGYCAAFGLDLPQRSPETDWQGVLTARAEREARLDAANPARARERARKAAETAERNRVAALESAERVALWLAGEPIHLHWNEGWRPDRTGALLRVRGDKLETGLGAEVPLAHAVRVFQLAKHCRETGTVWERNGHTVRVGHFQVDAIRNDGSIVAGCHVLQWDEIEAAARAANVWDAPAQAPHCIAEARESV